MSDEGRAATARAPTASEASSGASRPTPSRLAETIRPLFLDLGEYSRVLLPVQRLWGYQVRPGRGAQFRHEFRQLARKTGARNRQKRMLAVHGG